MKKNAVISLFLVFALLVFSCKKEEEKAKSTMVGEIKYNLPTYVLSGQLLATSCGGILTPRGVSYFWTSTDMQISLDPDVDTVRGNSVLFYAPDEAGDYTIMASAEYNGYYRKTKTHTIKVLSEDGSSISGIKPVEEHFVDPRDGVSYPVIEVGHLKWFAANLQYYDSEDEVGLGYDGNLSAGKYFGLLYSWNEATGGVSGTGLGGGPQGRCPEGWSIPTDDDWVDFANSIQQDGSYGYEDRWLRLGDMASADALINGDHFWPYSSNNQHSNVVAWNAIPAGNIVKEVVYDVETFVSQNLGNYGWWWSSTEREDNCASCRYIFYNQSTFDRLLTDRDNFCASIRCVKLK